MANRIDSAKKKLDKAAAAFEKQYDVLNEAIEDVFAALEAQQDDGK